MNTLGMKIFKRIIPLIFLFILVFEIQRAFTDFPAIRVPGLNSRVTLAMSQSLNMHALMGDWSTFGYFTTLSNILFITTFVAAWTFKFKVSAYWKLSINIYMIITGFVFWTSLAPFVAWGRSPYNDFMNTQEHAVVLLASLVFYQLEKKPLKFGRALPLSLIFPFCYLVFALIIQSVSQGQVAPYPFLNFENVFSANLPAFVSIVVSLLIVVAIGLAITLINLLYINPRSFLKVKRAFVWNIKT